MARLEVACSMVELQGGMTAGRVNEWKFPKGQAPEIGVVAAPRQLCGRRLGERRGAGAITDRAGLYGQSSTIAGCRRSSGTGARRHGSRLRTVVPTQRQPMKADAAGCQKRFTDGSRRAQQLSPLQLQAAQFAQQVTPALETPQLGGNAESVRRISADIADPLPSGAAETQLEVFFSATPFGRHLTTFRSLTRPDQPSTVAADSIPETAPARRRSSRWSRRTTSRLLVALR